MCICTIFIKLDKYLYMHIYSSGSCLFLFGALIHLVWCMVWDMIQLYLLPKWQSSYLNIIFQNHCIFPSILFVTFIRLKILPYRWAVPRLHIILQWFCDYSCAIITLFLAVTSCVTRCGWFPHTSLFQPSYSCAFVFHINLAVNFGI